MEKCILDSHSGSTDLMKDGLGFGPFLYVIRLSPGIHLTNDSINQILFLSRLGKYGLTLIIEASQDLLEFIDGVMLDSMPQILGGIK